MNKASLLVCLSLSVFALNARADDYSGNSADHATPGTAASIQPTDDGTRTSVTGATSPTQASLPTEFGSTTPGTSQAFRGGSTKAGDTRSKAQKIADFKAARAEKRQAFLAKTAQWRAARQARKTGTRYNQHNEDGTNSESGGGGNEGGGDGGGN